VGFDGRTGRAIGTWIVVGEQSLRQLEGSYDMGRRERVMEYDTHDADGRTRRFREVSRVLDAEHRRFELLELGTSGEQTVVLQADLVLRPRAEAVEPEETQPAEHADTGPGDTESGND
jgi:hypothetical protein